MKKAADAAFFLSQFTLISSALRSSGIAGQVVPEYVRQLLAQINNTKSDLTQ